MHVRAHDRPWQRLYDTRPGAANVCKALSIIAGRNLRTSSPDIPRPLHWPCTEKTVWSTSAWSFTDVGIRYAQRRHCSALTIGVAWMLL